MSDYIKRQESEKTVFAYGQYFQMCGKTETSDGNLRSPEKCTESLSENEQLKQQLEEARASIDKLSWQLAETRIKYPDAKLSSGETSESLSRVEEPALIRSQSMPAQLLTAHRKIDLLQVTNTPTFLCIYIILHIYHSNAMPFALLVLVVLIIRRSMITSWLRRRRPSQLWSPR